MSTLIPFYAPYASLFTLHFLLQLHPHAQTYSCPLPPSSPQASNLGGPCVPSLCFWPDFTLLPPTPSSSSVPVFSAPPGPSLPCPREPPLHHHPLRPLTVPQRESTTLMDATDGPFPRSSQPWRSVCSPGSEARPPHEMHVVTGNKRRAPVPTNSHSTPSGPPIPSQKTGGNNQGGRVRARAARGLKVGGGIVEK